MIDGTLNPMAPKGSGALPSIRRRAQIRRRLAVISAIATGTVMLAFCLPLAFYVRSVAYDRAVDGAELEARALAAELANIKGVAVIAHLVRQANSASANQVTVYLGNGRRLGAPLGSSVRIPPAVLAEHAITTTAPNGGRLAWEPVHDRLTVAAVVAQVPPRLLTSGVASTWALLFGGGALLVLVAVGLADWLGRSIVRPLLGLVQVTHRLRDGELDCRAGPAGPYEVAEVGQAVNELADRIDELLASARLAAADLGHRLRTPLTALRLDVEALGDPAAKDRLQQDLDTLAEAVNELIRQTRDTPPQVAARSDLAEAVRDRMAFWSVLARSQSLLVDVQVPERQVDVGISRDELDAAIDALLSNVFAHTPEGTGFGVVLRRPARGAPSWSLLVENQSSPVVRSAGSPSGEPGPVTAQPPVAVEREPVRLADQQAANSARLARSATMPPGRVGTGLGLDIIRRTAAKVGGTVRAGTTPGGGFRVEVTFPEGPSGGQAVPGSGDLAAS